MKITRTTAIPLSYRLPEGSTVRLGISATSSSGCSGGVTVSQRPPPCMGMSVCFLKPSLLT